MATVRLRESRPGVYRLDHDAGQHDDRAVALGLAALALTERTEVRGGITTPTNLPPFTRTLHDAHPSLPTRLAVQRAGRRGPHGLPGGAVVGVRGAYDDPNWR